MVPLDIVEATKSEDERYNVNGLTNVWETRTKQECYPPIYQTSDRPWSHVRNAELPQYLMIKGCFYPSSPPGCAKGVLMVAVMVTVTVISNCMKIDPSSSNYRTDPVTVMTSEDSAWSSPGSTLTDVWTARVPSTALWNWSKTPITREHQCELSPHTSDGSIPVLYSIVNNMNQSDDSWRKFRNEYQKFWVTSLTGNGYDLSNKEVCHVFSIRHSARKEIILTVSAASNKSPPPTP